MCSLRPILVPFVFVFFSARVKGWKAPQAAGVIHSDFERGFICAEVIKYEELKALGTIAEVKAAGKFRQEGKQYVVEDGDILNFKVC